MSEMGKMGFVWWFGVVEDVMDPLQLGRVKVRVYHFYSMNNSLLPTEDLPWAHIVMPTTSASYQGKGWSPTFIRPDSTVFGFFVDGPQGQMPIVLGTYPGIPQPNPDFTDTDNFTSDMHDVSQLARGVNKLSSAKAEVRSKEDNPMEPPPTATFGAQYPYNKVFESERGHAIEMDDTPGAERIHVYHNSGSYVEMSNGMTVDKTNGIRINTATVGHYTKSNGDMFVVADGALTIYAKGAINMASDKQISMSAPLININGTAAVNINTAGMLSMSGSTTTVSGILGLWLNPGSTVS
jgi:hypothetical protein